mgnify:CR=1 FL=1
MIGADGKQLGVMSLREALDIAQKAGVDLVEISPKANPPVAKIVDWGKYQYQKMKEQQLNAPAPAEPLFSVPKTLSEYDTAIIGTPLASQEQCVNYLLSVNPHPAISVSPHELVAYYYEEGTREGIRPDVAFAQALKETGFFRYGGTVTPDQNNYCGLGTTSATVKGAYFATSQIGVRAHIQHLLAYASTRMPAQPVVDPRYNLVRNVYGTSTLGHWQDLNGRWAVPGDSYGQSILSMFRAILRK